MKRWAALVAILYVLMLGVVSLPLCLLAFIDSSGAKGIATTFGQWQHWRLSQAWDGMLFNGIRGTYRDLYWWIWLVVMGLAQAALLAVPVRVASRRPMTRLPLALTILVGALMMGLLVYGAFYSLYEFAFSGNNPWKWSSGIALALGVAAWFAWALIFLRFSKSSNADDFVSRLCKCLLKGSILELLIAVPTHIVARCRDYCCAGWGTFVGLTLGMSVMLFSFGPGVFFLFAARWRKLHPSQDAQREECSSRNR
jgi:hypothetical protein